MRKPDLSGAYGVVTPPPAVAFAADPERLLRYSRGLRLLWVVRLGAVAVLLYLLYVTHLI